MSDELTLFLDFTHGGEAAAVKTRELGRGALIVCPKCGGKRLDLGGAHSPHFKAGVLVDCVGDEVGP